MSTSAIKNAALIGAISGLTFKSGGASQDPLSYQQLVNIAVAIANEVIVANSLLLLPMTDQENSQISELVQAVTEEQLSNRSLTSVTSGDYLAIAKRIVAIARQAALSLVVSSFPNYDTQLISVPIPGGLASLTSTIIPVNVAAQFPGLDVGTHIAATNSNNVLSFLPNGIPVVVGAEFSALQEISFMVFNASGLATAPGNLTVEVTVHSH